MRPWLLETPQTEEASLICGTAGKGPPAWDAGVTCPALHLQVKSLQRRHRHLSLTTTWRRQENVQIQDQNTLMMDTLGLSMSTELIYRLKSTANMCCCHNLLDHLI